MSNMPYGTVTSVLAISSVVVAGATLYFFVFWRWFEFWRRHRIATYTMAIVTFAVLGVVVGSWRREIFELRTEMPALVRGIGWIVVSLSLVLGFVADRQIGIRVRSFAPFFDEVGRLDLVTTGAYGLVRHPIYSAGIWYQLGTILITGSVAVSAAWIVLVLGARWFTKQEERRVVLLLDDPTEYERYRKRVPALVPWFGTRDR